MIKLKHFAVIALLSTSIVFSNMVEAVGAVGTQGPTGPKGPIGPKGDKGPQGPQGVQGKEGPVGKKGPTGAKGDKGATGDKGASGPQGARGPLGPAGASQGAKGDTGLQGPKGDTGDTGPKGDTGPAGLPQAGNNVGDMQYWDGFNWVLIPAPIPLPVAPASVVLRFCNGAPTWDSKCVPSNGTVYNIGANGPAGGYVFYLTDNTGLHGLEAAPVDQTSLLGVIWGCYGSIISGSNGTAVGTGITNTAAIVSGCADANTAAKIADSYELNGYIDWFLPSQDELNLLYQQRGLVPGLVGNNTYYWSSTQISNNLAIHQYFTNFNQSATNKSNAYSVRAIRSF